MEFTLLFAGELPTSKGTKGRLGVKHEIRRKFHPQLKLLWSMNPNLRTLASRYFERGPEEKNDPYPSDRERFQRGIEALGRNWNRAGFDFVPLVTPEMALRCSLDISLLRPNEEGFIYEQGDIDGQLKTLFDSLRMPDSPSETGGATPGEGENPFYCLLNDDRLITEVKVSTDQLLLLPNEQEVRPNDAHVVIRVKLNHKDARTFDNYFG